MNQGTYQIVLRLKQTIQLQVGGLGVHRFPQGRYVYTGRASRGLSQRIQRHKRKDKICHWHIDYLTSHPQVIIEKVQILSIDPGQECAENRKMIAHEGYEVPVVGFGSSDCHAGCPAHLFRQLTQ